MKLTYLSLGSNIGDKKNHLQSALNKIDRTIGNIISISSLYENPSEGFEGEMFYNCYISLETTFSAKELLKKLLVVEKEGGRVRSIDKGYVSRSIDLDILFYEDEIINSKDLIIPHPKLHQRKFVIKPLLEIAKGKIHPIIKKSILQMAEDLKDFSEIKKIKEQLLNPVYNSLLSYNNIVVEGNIGVGKTSLSKKLSSDLNKNLILEGFKENPFLEKFYEDSKRYALNLELTFLIDRCRQLNDYKNQLDLFKTGVVFDYDIVKSLIFAGITLSENDFNLYRNIFYFMTKDLIKPGLVIFLMQSPENLLNNIKKRGRYFENKIEKDYLKKINQAYLKSLKSNSNLNTVFIDVSDINFVENKLDYMELLFRIKKSLV